MNHTFRFRNKYFWVGLSTLFLLGIFLAILDPSDILVAVSKVGWLGLGQIFVLVAVTQIIRAVRFFELLSLRINVQYSLVLQITCIYQFLNHILPIRSGELSLPFLLNRYSGCTYSSSIASLLMTRIYDALALGVIVFFGAIVLIYEGRIESFWLFILVGVALLVMLSTGLLFLWIMRRKQKSNTLNKQTVTRESSTFNKIIAKVRNFASNLYKDFLIYRGILLHLRLFGYSILLWLVLFTIFWRILQLLGFYISLPEVVLGSSLANLTQLLPINTLGNLGTLEAGWVFGFTLLGFDSYKMLTAGLVMHIIVILAAGTYGIIGWLLLSLQRKLNRDI